MPKAETEGLNWVDGVVDVEADVPCPLVFEVLTDKLPNWAMKSSFGSFFVSPNINEEATSPSPVEFDEGLPFIVAHGDCPWPWF